MNAKRYAGVAALALLAAATGCGAGGADREYALGDIRETVKPNAETCQAGEYREKDGRATHRTQAQVEASYMHWHRQAWQACLEGLVASKGAKAPEPLIVQGWAPETSGCADGHALALRQFEAARAKHGLAAALESAGKALKQ